MDERVEHVEEVEEPLPRAAALSRPRLRVDEELARLGEKRRGTAVVVAHFDGRVLDNPNALEPILASLASRAIEVNHLDAVQIEVPESLGVATRRIAAKSAIAAAVAAALGAPIGALAVRDEALFPEIGWIPGPLAGALAVAGLAFMLGFVVAAIVLLLRPSLALSRGSTPQVVVIVRARPFDLDAIVARIMEVGGMIEAVGEG
jgi:hypothetical protein